MTAESAQPTENKSETNSSMTDEQLVALFEEKIGHLDIKHGNIISGQIIEVNKDYIVVDSELKSESIVPRFEFEADEAEKPLAVGDHYDLYLESVENGYGETCLSRDKARKAVEWRDIEAAYDAGKPVLGRITDRVKGGFSIIVNSVKGFLPGSQVDVKPMKNQDFLVGQEMEFKVVKIDKKRNNIVVSRRSILEEQGSEERTKLLDSLAVGITVKGIVKNLTDYGAFVDLGGIDGLLHITDMSWKRIKHPSELIQIGDEIDVKVLSFDREKKRVSLGLKQLAEDPWEDLQEQYPLNSKVFGKVTNITEYGCFVEITNAIEGLVHMSEMDWTNKNVKPSNLVHVGDEVEVMILDIDKNKRRISLGLKQCQMNPWAEFANNHQKDDIIKGKIKTITDFGVFIGLDGGIDGLIHATDLSWTEPGEQMIRQMKKGEEIEAIVLSIDPERERVSLGAKQITSDPFADFCEQTPRNTKITVTVRSVEGNNVIVKVNDQINGIIRSDECPANVKEGDSLDTYVTLHESRNYLLPLSMSKSSSSHHVKQEYDKMQASRDVDSGSIGDMIKKKLDDTDPS
ncbi:MAG: 30S ribosomal protein S1 [Legionellales bacterium]|nr:30S ribosomal protein S1 [Legionellales bacterium]|tara:strand:- start:631 stop:2346 length:1716 start_codon:yes stop_codon:yes gene_type:complete